MTKKIYWRDFSAALIVLAIGIAFLFWARTYPPKAAEVPVLIAWMTIVLASLDAIAQTETGLGTTIRRFVAAQKIIEWKAEGDEEAPTSRIVSAIFWILAYLGGVWVIGFLPMTLFYIFLYMKLHGHKSILASGVTAAGTTIGLWLTFEIMFNYSLYRGLLFGGN